LLQAGRIIGGPTKLHTVAAKVVKPNWHDTRASPET
jgi:hypothetical protein